MLAEAMVALAAGGGAAVVQAAGTDAWAAMRERIVQMFSRGDEPAAAAARQRLDRTAADLQETPEGDEVQTDRARLEAAAWRARFEDLLEGLPPAERQETALHLAELVD